MGRRLNTCGFKIRIPCLAAVHGSSRGGFLPVLFENLPACQPAVGFIVDAPSEAFQTGAQGQRLDMKYRILLIGPGQVVIGDLRTQVMDVVEADVPREPLQQGREFIE